MANPEHLEILKQGVEVWNEWRKENPKINPNLSRVVLKKKNLQGVNLSCANLTHADLYKADLKNANLTGVNSEDARFVAANLTSARLVGALLIHVDFTRANLSRTKFDNARMGYTIFGENDLSEASGLVTVKHYAPSIIDIQTIYQSKGLIPKLFLQKSGVPESFITYIDSLVVQSIEFYSCFISYSSKDQDFANRLYADLQNKGVRCWLASEDLKIGAEIRTGIDESIRLHDKLLLVLSETSVKSQWVQQEVETALAEEREQGRTVLFPIRLDDTVMQIDKGWPAYLRNTRNIGDFTRWKDHDSYQKAFDRLIRDLKAEEKSDSNQ